MHAYLKHVVIFVANKLNEITQAIIPYFYPALKDENKIWGEKYSHTLPSLVDPYKMYVHVS